MTAGWALVHHGNMDMDTEHKGLVWGKQGGTCGGRAERSRAKALWWGREQVSPKNGAYRAL